VEDWAEVQQLIVEAVRHRSVLHLELQPLQRSDSEALVAVLPAAGLHDHARKTLVARSGGNPLFIEQLVEAPHGAELPASLVNLLRERLSRLGSAASRLVQLAAVGGVSVPALVLEEASAMLSIDTLGAATEARSAGLLVIGDDPAGEAYGFRHPLLQEVVYADLIPIERRRLHRTMAEVISRRLEDNTHESGWAIELARHWWAAGEQVRAYPAMVAAAQAAERAGIQGSSYPVRACAVDRATGHGAAGLAADRLACRPIS
jgi:predicted ATPase